MPQLNSDLQILEQTNQLVAIAGDQRSDGDGRNAAVVAARHSLPPVVAHDVSPSENSASNYSVAAPSSFSTDSVQEPAPPATLVGRILEAIPKPLQATTIVIRPEGFGTIQIRISPQSAGADGAWRITIRASDPAAHALLKESVNEIRQNLKSDAVNIIGATATETTTGAARGSQDGSSLNDSKQERRQQFEQKNSRNRSRGEVFTIPDMDE